MLEKLRIPRIHIRLFRDAQPTAAESEMMDIM
jgi:hypothetical protein